MKTASPRQSRKAFTMVEMITVVTIAALLMAVALPNVPGMIRNVKMSNAKNMVKTALAQAQGYAIRNGVNAGIRFQKAANGRTYMVMIVNERKFDWYGTYYITGKSVLLIPLTIPIAMLRLTMPVQNRCRKVLG